jgi:ATP-binding cassette, subfamily B, bacterial
MTAHGDGRTHRGENPPAASPDVPAPAVLKRLFALTWTHRARCAGILALQGALLTLGVASLAVTGTGIDVIRHAVDPGSPAPRWPAGFEPSWSPMAVVAVLAGAVFVMACLRAWLNYFYTWRLAEFVQRDVVAEIRSRVYDKLQHLSFRFFDDQPSGAIINRVTADVQQLRAFIDGVVMQSIIMLISLVLYVAYMVRLHPWLTLACLATTPVLWLAAIRFSIRVRPAYLRNRRLVDGMVHYLSECVQGIPVVKGFGLEPVVAGRFAARNDEVFTQQLWIFRRVSLFTPFVGFLTQINLFVLLLYGGWMVIHGQLALGSGLVVFAGLLQQFSGQVSNLATVTNTMQQSLAGARRVFEILDAPVEIRNPPGGHRPTRARGSLEFEKVAFSYATDEPALEGVSLCLEPGQCLAILGATGSGKSTLLALVPRFYDPTGGRVLLDGIDLRAWDVSCLRRQIGIVFQENFLFSRPVAENIAFGHPEATRAQIEQAARLAAADTFIRALPEGYDTVIGEFGADLSGGQRQRLAIARALLLEPPVLLMDDPTAAIDPLTGGEIFDAMESAMAGRTTLLVAHRIETLRRAHRILVLDRGRVAQFGTHAELIGRPGIYRNVVGMQETSAP